MCFIEKQLTVEDLYFKEASPRPKYFIQIKENMFPTFGTGKYQSKFCCNPVGNIKCNAEFNFNLF